MLISKFDIEMVQLFLDTVVDYSDLPAEVKNILLKLPHFLQAIETMDSGLENIVRHIDNTKDNLAMYSGARAIAMGTLETVWGKEE